MHNIILTGMRGTGKTTLGTVLAAHLGWNFMDLDEWIEQKSGKSGHELVMNEGWEKFRALEKEAVAACNELEKTVIATGGGTLMDEDNAARLKKNGIVILLIAEFATLQKNLAESHARPSLTGQGSAADELETVWEDRRNRYHAVADLIHNTTHGMDLDGLLKKLHPKSFNTLVIGSGIAGLNFALNAAQYGSVLIVTKKRTVESSTNRAQGGIAAVLDSADRFEQHIKDTLEAGSHHNVRRVVEFMVKKGPEAILRLIEIGVPFATDENGKLRLTKEGGHHGRRIAFVGDYTGQEIEKNLIEAVKNNKNITVWEYTFAVDLLVKEGVCHGVQVIHKQKTVNLFAHNTVLATGGIGQLYRYTTNPIISMGDGIGMGLRAGLKTRDMEFIQFHPTALKPGGRTKFLLSEALRGEGAYLVDNKGKRFMRKIHPLAELAPRDVVARETYHHDLHGGVFLDLRHLHAKEVKLRFPQIYQTCKKYGYDLTKDLIPIAPAAHYCCGGLVTNLRGETGIKGLYAFGEVAWTGVHGANRLASNSLLEALVFSNQILPALTRASEAKPSELTLPVRTTDFFPTPVYQPASPLLWKKLQAIRKSLQKTMTERVGILRNTKDLEYAEKDVQKLLKSLPRLKTLNVPLKETENMLLAALEIIHAAQKRKKSLGCHWRGTII